MSTWVCPFGTAIVFRCRLRHWCLGVPIRNRECSLLQARRPWQPESLGGNKRKQGHINTFTVYMVWGVVGFPGGDDAGCVRYACWNLVWYTLAARVRRCLA
jgi:hypothetical protein